MEYVITILGKDRPGLVAAVAESVKEAGGNWLESRMSRLAGQFAGLLLVSAPDSSADSLREALEKLRDTGLAVQILVGGSHYEGVDEADLPEQLLRVELIGHDRPGIVREISQAIARARGNVEEMDTGTHAAAMSGEMLFEADILLTLPVGSDAEALRSDLEGIAQSLMVDIKLETQAE